jgi:hypothetical protein
MAALKLFRLAKDSGTAVSTNEMHNMGCETKGNKADEVINKVLHF